ncbi:MAG: T9SS type A sorting domain-containing protein [Candidatus Marinimicrobia bacterium]|nr:T9SS type A sorting domain-containing protein [Candidatus Neomarinimicrobiota bacterium]
MRKASTYLSILIVLLVNNVYSECDYIAMLAKKGHTIGDFEVRPGNYDDADDYFRFLINKSSVNPDGYGIAYYESNGEWDAIYSTNSYSLNPGPMDSVIEAILPGNDGEANETIIVFGHDRNGTGGEGNHPFRYEESGKMYFFQHNGSLDNYWSDMKTPIHDFLLEEYKVDYWSTEYPSNWEGVPGNVGSWIDSELLFHYLMYWIAQNDGDIIEGLLEAMNQTDISGYNVRNAFEWNNQQSLNFMFSDGNGLYLFKNVDDDEDYIDHYLSYRDFGDGFVAVKSDNTIPGGMQVPQFSIVHIPIDGNITVIDDFRNYYNTSAFEMKPFHSGWNWVGFPILEDNDGVSISDVFYSITQQQGGYTADQIVIITKIAGYDNYAYWYEGEGDWNFSGQEFNIDSFHGYKVWLPEDYEHYTIPMSGTQISEDAVLSFDAGINMVPYFRNLSHGIFQTLPQEVQDVLVSVRSEDWFMSKNSNGTWKIPSTVPHGTSIGGGVAPLRYGKAYEMTFTDAVEFQWQPHDGHEHYVQKRAEHFSYTKDACYIPLYIDGIDSEEDIEEVGAFVGLECVGAEVVDQYPVGMKLYTNYQNIEDLTFQVKLKENGLGKRRNQQDKETIYRQGHISDYSENHIRSVDLVMTTVKTGQDHQASNISLVSAYPNPFNPNTNIQFNLKEETRIELSIYDIQVSKVVTLIRGNLGTGSHSYLWDGTNEVGQPVSSGLYLYQLRNTQEIINQKIMLLK